jgi:hypothetical protein
LPIQHVVEQGEHLTSIAIRYGFRDYRTLWNDPENAALQQSRTNPNVLAPGDVVSIPDRTTKEHPGATAQRHRFVLRRPPLWLRVTLYRFDRAPLADTPVELEVDGQVQTLQTDGTGLVEAAIRPDAARAVLRADGQEFELHVGHLDPIEQRSGLVARLRNLGYLPEALEGDAEGDADPEDLRFGVTLFQRDYDMPIDGNDVEGVLARLADLHGC